MNDHSRDLQAELRGKPLNPYGVLGCLILLVSCAAVCLLAYTVTTWAVRGWSCGL